MNEIKESLVAWWTSISQREQRVLLLGALVLVIGGVYWGLVEPMKQRAENAQTRINSEKQLLQWVKDKADSIVVLRGNEGVTTSSEPFNQVISTSAKTYKIELIRIQPKDEMLQVWIKPVVFDQFVHWLAYLQQKQGIQVEIMDISRSDTKGVIEVKRLQLKRGG